MSDTIDRPTNQRRQSRASPYSGAGPTRLARTPGVAPRSAPTPKGWANIKRHAEARINMLRNWRMSWMIHYQLLESYILPRRGIFINTAQPTPNSMIRGMPVNQNIIDPSGTYAMRRCAAGLMSNEMSPSRQWFKLKPALVAREKAPPDAVAWFEEVEDRMDVVMGRSNFYQEASQMFEDLVTFGTGPMIIYEDEQDLIRCYTPCCGEYMLASSSANRAESMARLFVMTVSAIVEMFKLENCPAQIQDLWAQKGGALEQERLVAHLIEPNMAIEGPGFGEDVGVVPGGFSWRESYWLWGSSAEGPLALTGFHDQPHIAPRWAVTSNDAYGRSVGMDVLPDIIQLQVMTERLAEAEEKMVRPPMLADITMKNEPASILPGKVTYVAGLGPDKGMRPAFQVNPQIKEFAETILQVEQRIAQGFFGDLFAQLEQVTKQMTAYEVAARNQEKLQVLGPVVERLQNEALAPAIKRIFRIMWRRGLLPPLPKSLMGVPLGIEYVGVLALAQKAAKTASLERFASTVNSMVQLHPEVNDNVDWDVWTREYGTDLFLPQSILKTAEQVAELRQQRHQQQAAAQAMQAAGQASQIGKNLSDIDVGGGMNAVAALTGYGTDLGGSGGGGLAGAAPAGNA